MRVLQPLRAIAVVDLVASGEVGLVHGAIRSLQQHDRAVEEFLHLLVRILLRIVVETGSRLVDGFLDDDLAMKISQRLPPPRLQNQADAQQIPALFGLGLGVHVDQVLTE